MSMYYSNGSRKEYKVATYRAKFVRCERWSGYTSQRFSGGCISPPHTKKEWKKESKQLRCMLYKERDAGIKQVYIRRVVDDGCPAECKLWASKALKSEGRRIRKERENLGMRESLNSWAGGASHAWGCYRTSR